MTLYIYKGIAPIVDPSVFIAPTAQIIGDVHIGKESSIWFHSVLRGDMDKIRVGQRTNIQDLCVCHADENIPLTIGNDVTIGHRSIIHGCTIEDDCLIGMGAIIMNQAIIGRGSVVAAGTIVLEGNVIPEYSLVAGAPGKVKKTYKNKTDAKKAAIANARIYMETAKNYLSDKGFYQR